MKSNTIIENKNKLYWVYLIGFFLILALPLLNLPPWFSPPDWGKTIVFRIILSVLIFLFIYQLLFQQDKNSTIVGILSDRKSKVFWPFWSLVLLLGIYFLATIFSLDIRFSLWGSPYRSGGFVNFAFYIVFAILAFFILKEKDWQRIWVFSFGIGILVSLIAVFQQFGIFKKFLIFYDYRPPSTIGGPIFLAIYLLLLSFAALSFGLKTKKIIGKLFYFLSSLFFVFVAIFITQTRAVMIGYLAGFLFFIFFYPIKKPSVSNGMGPVKKFSFSLVLKLTFLILLLFGIYGIYFINTQTELPQFVQENKLLKGGAIRLSIKTGLADPRVSSWKVSLEALKNKPFFGYGPENFNVGFDKYYNPSLPEIARNPEAHSSWWDRAHNFVFDIGLTAGIPALLIYLTLFGTLFWRLQALKNAQRQSAIISGNQIIIYHGIQATFIGYFVANFFSFDTFSSYLISFLLISYSLNLIAQSEKSTIVEKPDRCRFLTIVRFLQRHRYSFISVLILCLVWFIWTYNIKPFKINTQLNIAKYLIGYKKCEQGFAVMDKVLSKKSFLDSYLRLKYTDFLRDCEIWHPEKTYEYAQKGAKLLKENIKIQPYYVRSWLLLAGFTNVLIDKEKSPENWEKMIQETKSYLEKAEELSPKRQEVFIEWAKYALVSDKYQLMKEKSQQCIDVNPNLGDCYWFNGLANIFLGNLEEGNKYLKIAQEKGYDIDSLISLTQSAKARSVAKNYQELIDVYQKLIALKPEEPQYHATLAFVYKELKDYKKAREEALKVLELQPEAREMVDEFLKALR